MWDAIADDFSEIDSDYLDFCDRINDSDSCNSSEEVSSNDDDEMPQVLPAMPVVNNGVDTAGLVPAVAQIGPVPAAPVQLPAFRCKCKCLAGFRLSEIE